jgi:hypothetical protein
METRRQAASVWLLLATRTGDGRVVFNGGCGPAPRDCRQTPRRHHQRQPRATPGIVGRWALGVGHRGRQLRLRQSRRGHLTSFQHHPKCADRVSCYCASQYDDRCLRHGKENQAGIGERTFLSTDKLGGITILPRPPDFSVRQLKEFFEQVFYFQ